jgi:glycerophosphoryl diester phosphodiesterase
MRIHSILFLLFGLLCAGFDTAHADHLIVVAHRGVVTDEISENSLASLEETIRRGYTHIEVDLRMTRDGTIVVLHDGSLKRTAGVSKRITDVTLEKLHSLVSPELVPTLEMFCEAAANRIELMPDIKGVPKGMEKQFAGQVEGLLSHYGLLAGSLFIGEKSIHEFIKSPRRIATRDSVDEITDFIARDPKYAATHFVFGHAVDFNAENVKAYQAQGLEVVVSVNLLHYKVNEALERGLKDTAAMIALGVDGVQIDSVYEGALEKN